MKTNPTQQPTPVQPADIPSATIKPIKKGKNPSTEELHKNIDDSKLVHGNTLKDQHIVDQPADQEEG